VITITAHTYGDAQNMRAMLLRTRDILPTMVGRAAPRIVRKFREQEARRFSTENALGPAGKWAALSPGYAAWKAKRYPGAKILERTGALRASLVGDGNGSVVVTLPNAVFIGSNVPYAQYHQTGTGSMPARPPINPSDRDVSEWMAEILRAFHAETSKIGWKGRFEGAMS
jgi:phage gpG-like protein